jgi:hypothetical protein
MTPLELLQRRLRTARLTDETVGTFETELARVLRALERELRPLVADASDLTRTQVIRAVRSLALRKQMREAIANAGFDDLLASATGDPLDALAKSVLSTTVGQRSAAFVSAIEPRIAALKALTLTDLLDQADQVTNVLWRAVTQGVFSARSTDQILTDLGAIIDDTEPHIRTLYDTSISIYGRQVEALTVPVDDVERAFVYLGPVDNKIRPFCAKHVGKVYTREEIDNLDNGQLPNTFLTGGGWACRHSFLAVSRFGELKAMVGTGERMPEIAEMLKGINVTAKAA